MTICLQTPRLQAQTLSDFKTQVASLIAAAEFQEALQVVNRGLERYSSDAYLLTAGAVISFKLGQLRQAETFLQQALRIPERPVSLTASLAELETRFNRQLEAREILSQALKTHPDNARIHYRMAYSMLATGDEKKALEHAETAVKLGSGSPKFRRLYALLLERDGKQKEAYSQLRVARDQAPYDTRLLLRLSDQERQAGRFMQAVEYLELAREIDPENPLYRSELARLFERMGREEEAAAHRKDSARLLRAFERYVEAIQLALRGAPREAVPLLEAGLEENPEFLTGALLLGDIYQKTGQEARAQQVYLNILKNDPSRAAARGELAWILAGEGELDRALDLLLQGDEVDRLNGLLLQAGESLDTADWDGAIRNLRAVEARYPLDPRLLQLISHSLHALGRSEEALAYLAKAHRMAPGDSSIEGDSRRIRYDQAIKLVDEGKWEAAAAVLKQLQRENPGTAEYLFRLGFVRQNQRRFEEATRLYTSGLTLSPEQEWVRANLALCLYYQNRFPEASRQWQQLQARWPSLEYLYQLGLARIREFKLQEGWDLVRQAAADGYRPAQDLLKRARLSEP